MKLRLGSLQVRLAARLGIVIMIATALVVGVILYQGYQAADELSNEQLNARANELARLAKSDPTGRPGLDLPPKLAHSYHTPAGADLFLVQDEQRRVIAASSTEFSSVASSLSI